MGWLRKGFSPDKGGRAPRGAVGCSACLVLCFLGFLGLGMGADFGQTAWIRLVSGFPPAAMAAENPLGRAQERTCREVEQRIKTLLSPVYGDGHVVVMASTEDAGKGGHIRAAIIIDTAAMQDVHLSPDGIVAEQNRIVRLVSHAPALILRPAIPWLSVFCRSARRKMTPLPCGYSWLRQAFCVFQPRAGCICV